MSDSRTGRFRLMLLHDGQLNIPTAVFNQVSSFRFLYVVLVWFQENYGM